MGILQNLRLCFKSSGFWKFCTFTHGFTDSMLDRIFGEKKNSIKNKQVTKSKQSYPACRVKGDFSNIRLVNIILLSVTWVKVFRINSEFRILRLTFQRKSASKC